MHSRHEYKVDELEEEGEEEESCGGGEAVDKAEVVHFVAVLRVHLQRRQEPARNAGLPDYLLTVRVGQLQSNTISEKVSPVRPLSVRSSSLVLKLGRALR